MKRLIKVFSYGDGEHFRRMTGIEIPGFLERSQSQGKDTSKIVDTYAYIMCKCMCDANGVRIYQDSDIDDLMHSDFTDLKDFAEAVLEKMGLGEEAKNLQADQ